MAGFHSFAEDCETAAGALNLSPVWDAAKIAATPLRHPCHATQTLPFESVAATGSMSDPGALEICTVAPGVPFLITRAKISKLARPFAARTFCDQNTHGRPCPSIAIAAR